ncbi:site-specific integrase [Mucilaginibacter sp.]|uniref:site-specific integrase n=1 Tax=Mucilaginibacter sp. TaxID=1882438 RepID=UPI0025CDA792|nr:site-specific integrase [Mucilaginibacter sp.]
MNFLKQEQSFKLSDIFREVNLYKNGHLFCAFMEQGIKDRQRTTVKKDMIKASTAASHQVTLEWFKRYLNFTDIEIHRIDNVVLEGFANYVGEHMIESSVWAKNKNIKSYISYAFRHKIMVNPFYKLFTVAKPEHDPTWLEEDELNELLNIYYGNNPLKQKLTFEQSRNCRAFLFACFTGLRISDLSRWNKDWIKNDHIAFVPQKVKKSIKNPKPIVIPIIPIAKQFIDELTAETFDLPEDQVYNRGLKVLAEIAGIEKNLTSHVARHTFATWLAIDNVPVLVISKLLGHKSTVTTMVYIHIAEEYMAREMMKMQRRFGMRPVQQLIA